MKFAANCFGKFSFGKLWQKKYKLNLQLQHCQSYFENSIQFYTFLNETNTKLKKK